MSTFAEQRKELAAKLKALEESALTELEGALATALGEVGRIQKEITSIDASRIFGEVFGKKGKGKTKGKAKAKYNVKSKAVAKTGKSTKKSNGKGVGKIVADALAKDKDVKAGDIIKKHPDLNPASIRVAVSTQKKKAAK